MNVLWDTVVGSHVWSMDTPDSDTDRFEVFLVPTKSILSGENHGGSSHFHSGDLFDRTAHEIGKVIDELIKGNFNFLTGVLSPIVVWQYRDYLTQLRDLVVMHAQTKSCRHSIRGFAIHHRKKYILSGSITDDQLLTKKCNMINRTLLFGINVLIGNGFEFTPVRQQTPDDVDKMIDEFDKAVTKSIIPEKTDPKPFREYLYAIRVKELKGML